MKDKNRYSLENLRRLGIDHCDADGRIFDKNGKEIRQFLAKAEHPISGNVCKYYIFNRYDPIAWKKQREEVRNGKNRSVNGIVSLSAHRVIYVLTYGEIDPELDVDHINDNNLDNRPENLQALTRQENIRKRKIQANQYTYKKKEEK